MPRSNNRSRSGVLCAALVFVLPAVLIFASFLSSTATAAEDQGSVGSPSGPRLRSLEQAANAALDVSESSIQRIAVRRPDDDRIFAPVVIEGQPVTLELEKHSIRSDDFQVLVQVDQTGALLPVEAPPVQTFRGTVRGMPEAKVAASFVNGRLRAVVHTPEEKYGVDSVTRLGLPGEADEYVVYRDSDWDSNEAHSCGTTLAHYMGEVDVFAQNGAASASASSSGTGLEITDLGLDADFDFYVLNGSDVGATVADMENIVLNMEPIYEVTGIGITYEITTVIVRTVSGTYTFTDAQDLLPQFRGVWNSLPESDIRRDVAHLFTGKNLDGTTIGIAYVSVVCGGSAYGLSQSRFSSNLTRRVALTSHEIGHNWSAFHCDGEPTGCHIMCSGLGGCDGILTSFAPISVTTISGFKDTRTCLSDLADPQTTPFFDPFPSTTLDTAKWSFNNGGAVNGDAENEPSGALSLNLDARGSGLYEDDEIRSNAIQLGSVITAALSYQTQHRGVESGEELVVEYLNDGQSWVELNRVTSDGSDQTAFDSYFHVLPADALHDEFRVRFRTEVDDAGDDWYIDDVGVQQDCNNNGVLDVCDVDCGDPGGDCDVPGCGGSLDCNGNLIPDECEDDCNGNGVPDDCDVANQTSPDCNGNNLPDECDIADQSSADCNNNAIPDECDIADMTSADCQPNGVPDECDIADLSSADCNSNGVPDECDIADLTSPDCQPNGVPDECDIASGTDPDCQPNGVPDFCDIRDGTSLDCNGPDSDCFSIHEEPGCDDPIVEDCVCGFQPDCCTNFWSSVCVTVTQSTCSNCPPPSGGDSIPDECQVACTGPEDCDDGDLCTDDVCTVDGFCTFPINYDTETECCDPLTGGITLIDDGNPCTVGSCNPDGSVTLTPVPDGPEPACASGDPCFDGVCSGGVCDVIPRLYGDVDGNGVRNLFDIFCVLDGIGGDFSTCSFEDDDVEPCGGNGTINLLDVFAVLNAIVGIDPCCGG